MFPCRREKRESSETLKDSEMSALFVSGLLTRQVGDQSQYLFAVAGAGKFISSISKGRRVSTNHVQSIIYHSIRVMYHISWFCVSETLY